MSSTIGRRDFLKKTMGLGLAACGVTRFIPSQLFHLSAEENVQKKQDVVVVKNGLPSQLVRKAIEAWGGMSRFVAKGDVVVVKPNISWDRLPQQAATTNPEIVAEVVKMCLECGAKKVEVFDRTCNEARRCYRRSGIQKAAEEAGAKVFFVPYDGAYKRKYKRVKIPEGQLLKSWEIHQDAIECDVLINLPIAKHHNLTRLTMGIKNLMGFLGGNRGEIHTHFDEKIVDIGTVLRPKLTLLDATRILLRNGPQGGNLADVRTLNTLVVGVDPVAVDSFGATLFGLEGEDLGYIRLACERGLGQSDMSKLIITTIDLT